MLRRFRSPARGWAAGPGGGPRARRVGAALGFIASGAALLAPVAARAECVATGGFPSIAASLAPFANGGAISALVSAINTSNTAFLTQSSAFIGSPADPQPGQFGGGAWARGVGGQSDFKTAATSTYAVGGSPLPGGVSCNTTTRLNFGGVQIGTDISRLNVGGWNLHFGGTLGYLGGGVRDVSPAGPLDPSGGTFGDTLQNPFVGLYAAATYGGLFMDGQVRWSYYQSKLSDPLQNGLFGQHLDARGVSLIGNVGYNVPLSNNWFVEPSAGILWSKVETDPLDVSGTIVLANPEGLAFPGTVSIGAITNTLGRVSLRAGMNASVGGLNVQPFVTVSGFHDFVQSQSATITTNLASIIGPGVPEIAGRLTTTGVGSYGQFGVGAAAQVPDTGWVGYIRADYRTGDHLDGWSVAAGARYQLPAEHAHVVSKSEEPVAQAAYDWSGFYLGPSLGADWGYTFWTFSNDARVAPRYAGILPGGQVGYNYQYGKWVMGVEGDMGWTNAHGARSCPNLFFFTCEANTNWLATIGGRIGYAYWDRLMFYGKGGLAIGQVEAHGRCNTAGEVLIFGAPLNTGCPAQGATNTALGWTLGLGTELGLTDNWSVKAEVSYFKLANKTYDFGQFSGGDFEVRQNGFIANIGLNYRFNPFAPAPVVVAKY